MKINQILKPAVRLKNKEYQIMLRIIILTTGLAFALASHAESNNEQLLSILAVSKMAGLCGAVQQMARFQDATQLTGGNDFIYRFVGTEAARLGIDHQLFLKHCEQAIERYDSYVQAISEK